MSQGIKILETLQDFPLLGELGPFAEMLQRLVLVFSVVSLILALLQCFFGYKMVRFWITLIGILVGFVLGIGISSALLKNVPGFVPLVIGIGGAILLGLLAFKLYLAGVFVFCGLLAAFAVQSLPFITDREEMLPLRVILGVVCFILAGILAVKFQRAVIIILTSVSGAISATSSLEALVPEIGRSGSIALIVLAGLAVLGMVVQFMTTRDMDRKKRR